ncbi:unnamed protein product, partial [Prorocentrum cordatum]
LATPHSFLCTIVARTQDPFRSPTAPHPTSPQVACRDCFFWSPDMPCQTTTWGWPTTRTSAHTAQACRDHPKITSTCEATFSTRPGGRGRGRYRARPAAPCASGPPLEAFPARRNQNEDDVGRGRSRGSSDPGQS